MSKTIFAEMLKEKKLKITPQRIAILEELDKNGHSTIEDIFNRIKIRVPSVSLATVYKNILALQNVNILTSVKTPITQKQKYEINTKPHLHLFCEICKNLEDFETNTKDFQEYCKKESGYDNIREISILLVGTCKKCANNK